MTYPVVLYRILLYRIISYYVVPSSSGSLFIFGTNLSFADISGNWTRHLNIGNWNIFMHMIICICLYDIYNI